MHDPMAMRPFMGYNFGAYLQHWLNMERPPHKVLKATHFLTLAYLTTAWTSGPQDLPRELVPAR